MQSSVTIWGEYVQPMFVIEVILKCFCRAKVRHPQRFLEKFMGQECLANIQ
jgi:hypothetical protein